MQRSTTIHDLPKTAIALLKAESVLDMSSFLLAALHGAKKCLIHHESFTPWLQDISINETELEFLSFSNDQKITPKALKSCEARDVLFFDFDIYMEVHGLREVMMILNEGRKHKKIYLVCPPHVENVNQLEVFATAAVSIRKNVNGKDFECSTVFFDKKGNITTSVHEALLTPNQKLTFKSLPKVPEGENFVLDQITKENEQIGKESMNLPFFASRQEDGVAIRDAATRKIRVGGQVVYEPDRDDDLDDSDPDDDLNI